MANKTLWELKPHTIGKHLVLKAYLDQWFPIMGQTQSRIIFVDGFAGPGQYLGGEDGSPLIAMRSFQEHILRSQIGAEVIFYFVEKNTRRKAHLESTIQETYPTPPSNWKIEIHQGRFDENVDNALADLEARKQKMAPSFFMIDPFGYGDPPMSIIRRILQHPKSEVFVSFMWDSVNRFLEDEEKAHFFDNLFGCDAWQGGRDLHGEERKKYLFDLYRRELKSAGAEQVLFFEIYKNKRLIYAIFFGTQHIKGSFAMKEAIWKATGEEVAFIGRQKSHQQELVFSKEPDFGKLQDTLLEQFAGKQVSIADLEEFMMSDQTLFRKAHLRKGGLDPLYDASKIEVSPPRKRKGSYPAGTEILFKKA